MAFLYGLFAKIGSVVSGVFIAVTGIVSPAPTQSIPSPISSSTPIEVAAPSPVPAKIQAVLLPNISTKSTEKQAVQAQSSNSQPGGITCNGKYYPPCTDGGQRICLDDGSNAYCRPPQSAAAPVINSPQTLAPQAAPQNSTYCNGKYWNQCSAGSSFVCPQSGDAYCQQASTSNNVSSGSGQTGWVWPDGTPVTQQQAQQLATEKTNAIATTLQQIKQVQVEAAQVIQQQTTCMSNLTATYGEVPPSGRLGQAYQIGLGQCSSYNYSISGYSAELQNLEKALQTYESIVVPH